MEKPKPGPRGKMKQERLGHGPESDGVALNFDSLNSDKLVKSQVSDIKLISERRSHIVRTAIDLFSRNGYYDTTVKELAEVAKVSPGLVYQYFNDKEDILFLSLQVVVHTINRVIPAAIQSVNHPVSRFIVAFTEYCRIVDQNRSAVQLTYRETKSLGKKYRDELKGMEIQTNELIKGCLEDCISGGYMRRINTDLFVYHVIMTAQAWSLKHWRLKNVTNINEYIRTNIDFLANSVLTRDGLQSYVDYIRQS